MPTAYRPMTDRQKRAVVLLVKDDAGTWHFEPDLAKQLVRRGLAELTGGKRVKTVYQRPKTLWQVRITAAGCNVASLCR